MKQRIKLIAVVCAILTLGIATVLVVTNHPTTDTQIERPVKFVLSSWSYPDEYGQGIESIYAYENSSGAYVEYPDSPYYSTDNILFEKNITGYVWLQIYCWFNRSLAGIPNSLPQGLNLIRHTATVTQSNGTVVFSQTNFTKTASSQAGDPIWWLRYEVVLAFVPTMGETYTATITYEVYEAIP
jgi:hypothetical protein